MNYGLSFFCIFAETKNEKLMVVRIENTASEENLRVSLERIRNIRGKRKKPNLAQFFGVLPNFDDGLEFQKQARNEWK